MIYRAGLKEIKYFRFQVLNLYNKNTKSLKGYTLFFVPYEGYMQMENAEM